MYLKKTIFKELCQIKQMRLYSVESTAKSSLGALKHLGLHENHAKFITTATKINLLPYSKSSVADKELR